MKKHLLIKAFKYVIFHTLQCRLIVSQMSNTRCEILPWILLPVTIATILSFVLPEMDLKSMYFVSILSLLAHIHYGTCVVCLHFFYVIGIL